DLRKSPTDNLRAISAALDRELGDLTVVILDRPRHEQLIREVRAAGARIRLIEDGDVAGGVATCFPETGVDVLMGTGGAPGGVITAAAGKAVRGGKAGRVQPRHEGGGGPRPGKGRDAPKRGAPPRGGRPGGGRVLRARGSPR